MYNIHKTCRFLMLDLILFIKKKPVKRQISCAGTFQMSYTHRSAPPPMREAESTPTP